MLSAAFSGPPITAGRASMTFYAGEVATPAHRAPIAYFIMPARQADFIFRRAATPCG